MGKPTLDMSRIRFCTLIFLTPFLFQFFSCSQKREIDPQEIVGRWELVSKGVKPIAYIELSF